MELRSTSSFVTFRLLANKIDRKYHENILHNKKQKVCMLLAILISPSAQLTTLTNTHQQPDIETCGHGLGDIQRCDYQPNCLGWQCQQRFIGTEITNMRMEPAKRMAKNSFRLCHHALPETNTCSREGNFPCEKHAILGEGSG